MKNRQNGYTLVEVLAALTIFTMIMGVASMLFYSLNDMWNDTETSRADHAELNTTFSILSGNLNESTKAAYLQSASVKQIRLKVGLATGGYAYRMLEYNITNKTLFLFDLTGVNDTTFVSSGTTANPQFLTDGLSSFIVTSNGNPINSTLSNGEKIEITCDYVSRDGKTDTHTIAYKLLLDH